MNSKNFSNYVMKETEFHSLVVGHSIKIEEKIKEFENI